MVLRLRSICLEGGMVGLADLDMIANDLAQRRLVRLFYIGVCMAPTYAYHLVYPEGSSEDARVVAFREWMLGRCVVKRGSRACLLCKDRARGTYKP